MLELARYLNIYVLLNIFSRSGLKIAGALHLIVKNEFNI